MEQFTNYMPPALSAQYLNTIDKNIQTCLNERAQLWQYTSISLATTGWQTITTDTNTYYKYILADVQLKKQDVAIITLSTRNSSLQRSEAISAEIQGKQIDGHIELYAYNSMPSHSIEIDVYYMQNILTNNDAQGDGVILSFGFSASEISGASEPVNALYATLAKDKTSIGKIDYWNWEKCDGGQIENVDPDYALSNTDGFKNFLFPYLLEQIEPSANLTPTEIYLTPEKNILYIASSSTSYYIYFYNNANKTWTLKDVTGIEDSVKPKVVYIGQNYYLINVNAGTYKLSYSGIYETFAISRLADTALYGEYNGFFYAITIPENMFEKCAKYTISYYTLQNNNWIKSDLESGNLNEDDHLIGYSWGYQILYVGHINIYNGKIPVFMWNVKKDNQTPRIICILPGEDAKKKAKVYASHVRESTLPSTAKYWSIYRGSDDATQTNIIGKFMYNEYPDTYERLSGYNSSLNNLLVRHNDNEYYSYIAFHKEIHALSSYYNVKDSQYINLGILIMQDKKNKTLTPYFHTSFDYSSLWITQRAYICNNKYYYYSLTNENKQYYSSTLSLEEGDKIFDFALTKTSDFSIPEEFADIQRHFADGFYRRYTSALAADQRSAGTIEYASTKNCYYYLSDSNLKNYANTIASSLPDTNNKLLEVFSVPMVSYAFNDAQYNQLPKAEAIPFELTNDGKIGERITDLNSSVQPGKLFNEKKGKLQGIYQNIGKENSTSHKLFKNNNIFTIPSILFPVFLYESSDNINYHQYLRNYCFVDENNIYFPALDIKDASKQGKINTPELTIGNTNYYYWVKVRNLPSPNMN